jgi:hypothetical protein
MQGVLRNMLFEDQVKAISTGTKYEGVAKKMKAILMPIE